MENLIAAWDLIKKNWIISIIILVAVMFLFFTKPLKKLFSSGTVRRKTRKQLPRSVGIKRRNKLPVNPGTGKTLKAWQIKGSDAARRHMARIRRMR
jgi:hypothetical protein